MDRIDRIINRCKQGFVSCAELFKKPTFAIKVNDADLIPPCRGWKLIEGVKEPSGIVTLEIVGFYEESHEHFASKGHYFPGDKEIIQFMKTNERFLGERTMRSLFAARNHIPREWRVIGNQNNQLFCPGTIWQDRDGHLRIPSMDFLGGNWYFDYEYLSDDGISFSQIESWFLRQIK
ncbi:MAG: hypothetical protein HYT12_00980 [Candidatus Liptonbacteria bacterium]|nr:hypothetical protein [Candidatus Liptonbacteria bacterium]